MRRNFALLGCALICVCLSRTTRANLFVNASFEEGAVASNGFGSVPDPWIPTSSLADTYDDTGVTAMSKMEGFGTPELMDGVLAFDGHRYLGVHTPYNGFSPDGFAQQLASPLTTGWTYTVSAYLLADNRGAFSGIFSNLGAIDVFGIRQTGGRDFLGRLEANSAGLIWEHRSVSFLAEHDYAFLDFNGSLDSPSAYMGVDAVDLVAVPEPVTTMILAVGAVGLLRRRLGPKSANLTS